MISKYLQELFTEWINFNPIIRIPIFPDDNRLKRFLLGRRILIEKVRICLRSNNDLIWIFYKICPPPAERAEGDDHMFALRHKSEILQS